MKKIFSLFIIFTFCTINTLYGINLKKVLRAIDKGDVEKAMGWIIEELKEENNNPGLYLIYARISAEDSLSYYNLDSARVLINVAISQYDTANAEILKDLSKVDFDSTTFYSEFYSIKEKIFQRTLENNSIESYNQFMTYYPGSVEVETAILKRDSIAFSNAQKINSWEAYKNFLRDYPGSRYFDEANRIYQKLLYEDKTASNAVSDLENFIEQFPDSPYRDVTISRLVEQKLTTADSKIFRSFINKYQYSKEIFRVADALYYLDKSDYLKNPITSLPDSYNDSLKNLFEIEKEKLVAYYENGLIGFINQSGISVIDPTFTRLFNANAFCSFSSEDVIAGEKGRSSIIVNRNNQLIYEGNFSEVLISENAFMLVEKGEKYDLITKNGCIITKNIDDFKLLDNSWLLVKRDDKFALVSFFGKMLSDYEFTSVYKLGNYYVFENDNDELALYDNTALLNDLKKSKITPDFKYDDIEAVSEQIIIGFKGEREALIGEGLEFLIPWGQYEVFSDPTFYYSKYDSIYQIFNPDIINFLGSNTFKEVIVSNSWIAFNDAFWRVYNRSTGEFFMKQYDSARILTQGTIMLELGGEKMLYFPNNNSISVNENNQIRSITLIDSEKEFIQLKEKDQISIFNDNGEVVLKNDFDEIVPAIDSTYIISKKGKRGLIDYDGNLLIKPEYDFIQPGEEGFNVLQKGKIGYYHPESELFFEPDFESLFEPVFSFFKTRKEDRYGLLDTNQDKILGFDFESIEVISNNYAWVKTDTTWSMVNLKNGEVSASGVKGFEPYKEVPYFEIRNENGFGVINQNGEYIIKPVYSDIILLSKQNPVFRAEKYFQEADYYIVAWYDKYGDIIYKNAYTSVDYEYLYCDE